MLGLKHRRREGDRMRARQVGWVMMTVLAFAVAGYALVILALDPSVQPPFVHALLDRHPVQAVAHFVGSALALGCGALQLNTRLRQRSPGTHRLLGRVYLAGVLAGGLSGFALALDASGGTMARLGFGVLSVLWLGFTASALVCIRRGDVAAHRRWMLRSYALTFGAVTLRLYLPASLIGGIAFEAAYPFIAWLAWVPNLLIVELWLRRATARPRERWQRA